MGKYDRLIIHLKHANAKATAMPMAVVDALTTGGLPDSRSLAAWWSGNERRWVAAGFDARLEPGDVVTFTARSGTVEVPPAVPIPVWALMMNEAAVELRLVLPLLDRLGYETADIAAKVPVTFQQGRRGRKPEADFIVFDGPTHTLDTSLLVVEAKGPKDTNGNAREQAESYAFAARAPFVLLCDPHTVELWRMHAHFVSERLVDCPVSDLEARWGEFERHLQRDALTAFVRSLRPSGVTTADDFSAYEVAELKRTDDKVRDAVSRRLSGLGDAEISSDALLDVPGRGAVIVAPSGLGKTTLSIALFRQALARRHGATPAALPVHLDLPDVHLDRSLLDQVQARLEAHMPGLKVPGLRDMAARQGLVLICDGFDRRTGPDQERLEVLLRELLRDLPALRLYVFSRPSAPPRVDLPISGLEPLDTSERREIAGRVLGLDAFHFDPPTALDELGANPLLWSLLLQRWQTSRSYPDRIEGLFEAWLDGLLRRDARRLTEYRARVAALEALAEAAQSGRVSFRTAATALAAASIPAERLDDLIALGALSEVGHDSLTFEHEALADFLWARRMNSRASSELLGFATSSALDSSSFLPVFLLAMTDDRTVQTALWDRLGRGQFSAYLDALRYASATEPDDSSGENGMLADILRGVADPLNAFFPQLRPLLERELSGSEEGEGLAIVGRATPTSLAYAFRRPSVDVAPVLVGDISGELNQSWRNMGFSGLTLADGRILGLNLLKDALLKAIKGGRVNGGPLFESERMRGWLMQFGEHIDGLPAPDAPLETWRTALLPYEGLWARDLAVDDVLDGLDRLAAFGVERLAPDALDRGWTAGVDLAELATAASLHFQRTIAVYQEIVGASFSRVTDQLGTHVALPVRWRLNVTASGTDGFVQHHWMPVDVDADTTPVVSLDPNYRDDGRLTWEAVAATMESLGRETTYLRVSSGWTRLSSLEDRSPERSCLRSALRLVADDIRRLFRHAPERGRDPGHGSPARRSGPS